MPEQGYRSALAQWRPCAALLFDVILLARTDYTRQGAVGGARDRPDQELGGGCGPSGYRPRPFLLV